ncbi:MAG: hypothetical protein J6W14_03675, partial [Clostridia bacterium]|nr:hypothetical protein [Clostridia bacterium]
ELALMKKACVMVPSPNVVDNHQYKNAKALADGDAVCLLEEKDMTTGIMAEKLRALLAQPETRKMMGENIAAFAFADANKLIYRELMQMCECYRQAHVGEEALPEIPAPDILPDQAEH